MPNISARNLQRQYLTNSPHQYGRQAPIKICTIALADGKFCNQTVRPDSPVSACDKHLRLAWSYCQAKLDMADDAAYFAARQALRDLIPPLRDQRLMDRVRKARSVVYYALADNYVKIGTTIHLNQRMKDLGANLVAVEPGSYDLERDRHRQFHALLASGKEYFFPGHELISHIAGLQQMYAA